MDLAEVNKIAKAAAQLHPAFVVVNGKHVEEGQETKLSFRSYKGVVGDEGGCNQ